MISPHELIEIRGGGFNFSAALITAISRGITTILNLGQVFGVTVRKLFRKYCR